MRESPTLYLSIGALGLVAFLALSELALRLFVVPVIDSRANRVHLVYGATNPDVVLGDSHLYRPFINSERFANLARAGSSPQALEIVAREYFRSMAPGRVIVEASPQLFRELMERRKAQRHDEYFTHNFALPFHLYVFEPGISRELAALWDPAALRKATEDARGRRHTAGIYVEREAARRRALGMDERRELTRSRLVSNRPVADVRSSHSFAAYRRTLEQLQARGAKLCLARTPVTDLFLQMSRNDSQYVAAEQVLRELADELGIRFVDYLDLELPLTVDAFTNPDHLTTRVGEIYAERLERACFGPSRAGP